MSWVVAHAGGLPDHLRHPAQRPQLIPVAVRLGPLQQCLLDRLQSLSVQAWSAARPTRSGHAGRAGLLPTALPDTGRLHADPELFGDLGRLEPVGEQRRRLLATPLEGVEVATRSNAHRALR